MNRRMCAAQQHGPRGAVLIVSLCRLNTDTAGRHPGGNLAYGPQELNGITSDILEHSGDRSSRSDRIPLPRDCKARRRPGDFSATVPTLSGPASEQTRFTLLLRQFKSPIILILIFAAVLSLFLKDRVDAGIILGIVLVSGLLSFWQERGATDAVEKLLAIVQVKATVLRDGKSADIPVEEVVPGDVVLLTAGDVIPGDCLLLESNELFADEATLTGETYPVEKQPGTLPADTPLAKRTNSLFMGTHVVSGSATAVVVHTAKDTEFGQVSERLRLRAAETEFEHGVRRFGYFLGEVTLVLVIVIFGINVYLHRPVLDSFLFSMALAVGLTPQLLPAIISINLAHGAKRMAEAEGHRQTPGRHREPRQHERALLRQDRDPHRGRGAAPRCSRCHGDDSDRVLLFAYLNAFYETGFPNPIDDAIRSYKKLDVSGYQKLARFPTTSCASA